MDTIQNYQCPCCGASLVFSGEELHCDSCGNSFGLEAIQEMNADAQTASGESGYHWDTYQPRSYEDTESVNLSDYNCPSCGAQITGDSTLGATVCPYCGNATILKEQFAGTLKPDYVIPFQLDKKAAMAAFETDFSKAPFLPDEFRSKKKIEEMSGVYVPFWMFDCNCDAAITYHATRISSWSDASYNYTKTDHYQLFRAGSISFANIPVDGSKKTDDTYMEALEPFDYSAAVDFNSAYLSGYLADKYDVSAEDCEGRANERVQNSTISAFDRTTDGYFGVNRSQTRISFSNGKIRYALLPVWMLNIKYEGNNYQYAINGQTGKVVGAYPIDKKKKWKFFAKVAGIAYLVAFILAYFLIQ